MVRAAQASPRSWVLRSISSLLRKNHTVPYKGACSTQRHGVSARAGDPSILLRVALEGRSLPVVHGCGWDSGAARERSSALAASVASRYELGADGVGAARPGARGSRVTASRYALGAEGGGAARPGPTCAPGVTAHVVSWGGWGCRRRRALRAAREARCKACFELLCGGRGWGGTP